MMNDNEFKMVITHPSKNNSFGKNIAVPFISGVLGCSLVLGTCFGVPSIKQKLFSGTGSSVSTSSGASASTSENSGTINTDLVSLSKYSDTAVYAANKILPSIVGISITYNVTSSSPLYSMFGQGRGSSTTSEATASGSGIIISDDGYIVTNNHVVDSSSESTYYDISEATSIKVSLYGDDTQYDAQIIGKDSQTDLAVLKIDKTGLTAAEFGDSSSVQIGEFVLAIGNPYNLDYSVTAGIISALDRKMTIENTTYKVIQADCAINSGNSGGALVNSKGQVIGITTLKLSGTGIEGVSFAIPINDTISIYQTLIEKGKISRPFVGISGLDIDEATAIRNGLTKGIYVDSVVSGSAAEEAGIKSGDVIVSFDGKSISTMDELNEIKNTKNIGDKVEIEFYRKNELKTVTITLGEI